MFLIASYYQATTVSKACHTETLCPARFREALEGQHYIELQMAHQEGWQCRAGWQLKLLCSSQQRRGKLQHGKFSLVRPSHRHKPGWWGCCCCWEGARHHQKSKRGGNRYLEWFGCISFVLSEYWPYYLQYQNKKNISVK